MFFMDPKLRVSRRARELRVRSVLGLVSVLILIGNISIAADDHQVCKGTEIQSSIGVEPQHDEVRFALYEKRPFDEVRIFLLIGDSVHERISTMRQDTDVFSTKVLLDKSDATHIDIATTWDLKKGASMSMKEHLKVDTATGQFVFEKTIEMGGNTVRTLINAICKVEE